MRCLAHVLPYVGADDLGSPTDGQPLSRHTPTAMVSHGRSASHALLLLPVRPALPPRFIPHRGRSAPRPLAQGRHEMRANKSPPCVREGGSRSETEGLSSFISGRRGLSTSLRCRYIGRSRASRAYHHFATLPLHRQIARFPRVPSPPTVRAHDRKPSLCKGGRLAKRDG